MTKHEDLEKFLFCGISFFAHKKSENKIKVMLNIYKNKLFKHKVFRKMKIFSIIGLRKIVGFAEGVAYCGEKVMRCLYGKERCCISDAKRGERRFWEVSCL